MTDPGQRLDVLVVGAGPTGLSLGLVLAGWGVSVRVVDQQLDRVHESRALAIQPRTLEVLDALGLSDPLLARGNDAVKVHLHVGRKVVEVPLFDAGLDDTRFPRLLFLAQSDTEAVLSDALAKRAVAAERGVELVSFSATPDGLACTLRHRSGRTEVVHTRFLVGCDGAHSTVRHQAGIAFEGSAYPQTFALADLEVAGDLRPDAAQMFAGQDGVLLFFPIRRPASWRIMAMVGSDPGAEQPSLARLQAIVDRFSGGTLVLRDPVWQTYFRLHQRLASSYRSGPVFLAGDAAHVHSPAGGQGMNTGIQDAANLGWKLALVSHGARADLLDSYQLERQPVGRFVLRLADRPFAIATSTTWWARTVRTKVMPRLAPLAVRARPARRYGFRVVSQLGIRYRDSPLSTEGRPGLRHRPRAGDRLPNAAVRRGGRPGWLHDILTEPRLHVLLCGPIGSWDAAVVATIRDRHPDLVAVHHLTPDPEPGALQDAEGSALHRLGAAARPAQFLVRPDGYLGYRSAGTDLSGLGAYLDRWLPPAAS